MNIDRISINKRTSPKIKPSTEDNQFGNSLAPGSTAIDSRDAKEVKDTCVQFYKHILNNSYSLVLFDLFDTLIVRTVYPEYIKKLASKRLGFLLGSHLQPDTIYRIRYQLESSLREANQQKGFDPEFRFSNFSKLFYHELLKQEGIPAKIDQNHFVTLCADVEIATEIRVQRLDKQVLELIYKLHKQAMPLAIISDFYLDQNLIRQTLDYHGITRFFNNIFMSSDRLLNKKSGRLYKHLLNQLDIPPDQVIMMGDRIDSDQTIPESIGIRAWVLPRNKQKRYYARHRSQTRTVNRNIKRIKQLMVQSAFQKRPFHEMTLILYYFIEKLYSRLIQKNINQVFFLSKEGQFLLNLFHIFQAQLAPPKKIAGHYLLVSRKSTFIASLENLNQEKFETLFRQYRDLSLNHFLLSLNFKEEEIQRIAEELKVSGHEVKKDFPSDPLFKRVRNNETFKQLYNKKLLEQKRNFIAYLHSFGVDTGKEGLHLVDIGGKGTMQDHIFKILARKITCVGLYIALVSPTMISDKNQKEGILYSNFPHRSRFYEVFNENKSLFEVILGTAHGSAEGYESRKDGKSISVKLSYDPLEHRQFESHIKPQQQLIKKEFNGWCRYFNTIHFSCETLLSFFAKAHGRMVFFPSNQELDFFKMISHYENFGIFDYTRFNQEKETSLPKRFRNLFLILKSPRAQLTKSWPVLKLSQMGLDFLKNIYGLLRYLHTIFLIKRNR